MPRKFQPPKPEFDPERAAAWGCIIGLCVACFLGFASALVTLFYLLTHH